MNNTTVAEQLKFWIDFLSTGLQCMFLILAKRLRSRKKELHLTAIVNISRNCIFFLNLFVQTYLFSQSQISAVCLIFLKFTELKFNQKSAFRCSNLHDLILLYFNLHPQLCFKNHCHNLCYSCYKNAATFFCLTD